jgi:proteic killer suppression protein
LEELYVKGRTAKIGKESHRKALLILDHIASITDLKDCVGVRDFHELKGDRKGTYSMHVTGNYCITFRWEDGDAIDVDFEDYHGK